MCVRDIARSLPEMYCEWSTTGGRFGNMTSSKLENNNNIKLIRAKDVYSKM